MGKSDVFTIAVSSIGLLMVGLGILIGSDLGKAEFKNNITPEYVECLSSTLDKGISMAGAIAECEPMENNDGN